MGSLHRQAGFSLLLYVLMILGMGGLLLEGYLQNARSAAERQKRLHDEEVLAIAKAALLQYAYNYPETIGRGPGRLPCADTDNDGQSNTDFVQCVSVGRFPFDEIYLGTPELRDSSGERLWYAVSGTFATNVQNNSAYVAPLAKHAGGKRFINSDAVGTITIKDQSGATVYDGAVNGVAAVIIAPGNPILRGGAIQDRSVNNNDDPYDLTPDTDPGIIDPENYLDLNGGQDNATLTHLDSNDGFQMGPVLNGQNDIVINDRVVVITSEEIVRVAQKAALQAYRNAVKDYQGAIWGSALADYRFPWLDDYTTTDLGEYDGDVGSIIGRIPSLFAPYFDAVISVSSESIESELTATVTYGGFETPEAALSDSVQVSFDTSANLSITPASTENTALVRYYWDEFLTPDGWELCAGPPFTGSVASCNAALASASPSPIRVLEVTYGRNFVAASTFQRLASNRTGSPLSYLPPDSAKHARVLAEYADLVSGDEIDASFRYQNAYYGPPSSFTGSDDSGDFTNYKLGVRFYPSLPVWALAGNDDWHDSILMAFSDAYQPGVASPTACIPNNADLNDDPGECLLVNNSSGSDNRFDAVLVLAGEHDLVDEASDGFQNDLADIFDGENAAAPETIFDKHAVPSPGNRADTLLILDQN